MYPHMDNNELYTAQFTPNISTVAKELTAILLTKHNPLLYIPTHVYTCTVSPTHY